MENIPQFQTCTSGTPHIHPNQIIMKLDLFILLLHTGLSSITQNNIKKLQLRFDANFCFLMNFELLTFPCREMNKLDMLPKRIHIIYKTCLLCDACNVYNRYSKTSNAIFLHYAFKSYVWVQFYLAIFSRI